MVEATPAPICPRCTTIVLGRDEEGDATCITCGWVQPPDVLPVRPENYKGASSKYWK